MQEAPRKVWFFSYGASGPSITNALWMSSTGVEIDECYTLTQRDLKYTLIHTVNRISVYRMKTIFKSFESETGIKGFCVFAYDEICYGDGIPEHPGMKLMVENMNTGSPSFEHWLLHGSLESNKRGLLSKYMLSNNLKDMSKSQLLIYIQDYKLKTDAKILETQQEHDAKIHEMEQEYRDMEAEIFRLRDKVKAQKSDIRLLQADNQMLRTTIERLSGH